MRYEAELYMNFRKANRDLDKLLEYDIRKEIFNMNNWKKTHKKAYTIYVCRPKIGTRCYNELEDAHYVTDLNRQFILSGMVGENWIIDISSLAKNYTFENKVPICNSTLKSKCDANGIIKWTKVTTIPNNTILWAFHVPLEVQNLGVKTCWGDKLYANKSGKDNYKGDFLICEDLGGKPDMNNVRVIDGRIFPKTYDLHSYPNMFSAKDMNGTAIKPKVNFWR